MALRAPEADGEDDYGVYESGEGACGDAGVSAELSS